MNKELITYDMLKASLKFAMKGTWNELCDEAIQYLNELKIKN